MLSSSGASVVRHHSSLVAGQDLSFTANKLISHLLRQPSMLTEQENIERPATKQVEALVLSTYPTQSMYAAGYQ